MALNKFAKVYFSIAAFYCMFIVIYVAALSQSTGFAGLENYIFIPIITLFSLPVILCIVLGIERVLAEEDRIT